MGWIVEDYRKELVWQHGGNTDGMTTAMGVMPEQKFGVVVLSNMLSAQLPAQLMRYIFDRQLNVPTRDLAARTPRQRADSSTVAQAGARTTAEPPVPLSAFVGTYADSMYGKATVSMKDGRLELVRGDWRGPLEYWNAMNFRWTVLPSSPTGPMYLKFEVSPDNRVTGLYFGLAGDQTLLAREGPAGGGRGRGRGGS